LFDSVAAALHRFTSSAVVSALFSAAMPYPRIASLSPPQQPLKCSPISSSTTVFIGIPREPPTLGDEYTAMVGPGAAHPWRAKCTAARLEQDWESRMADTSTLGAATNPGSVVNGIDVSHFQGSIDWEEVAAQGIGFAFVKAT